MPSSAATAAAETGPGRVARKRSRRSARVAAGTWLMRRFWHAGEPPSAGGGAVRARHVQRTYLEAPASAPGVEHHPGRGHMPRDHLVDLRLRPAAVEAGPFTVRA